MRGMFEVLRMLRGAGRYPALAGLLLILSGVSAAEAFDTASYQPADLDVIARRKPPLGLGADVYPVQSIRLDVTLAAQAAPCPTKYLKWAMRKSGIAKDAIDSTPITRCIKVKSAKARQYQMFIQDSLADSLARDVPAGGKLTVYASLVYFAQQGPGIVVNAFDAPQTASPQSHSAVDLSATAKQK